MTHLPSLPAELLPARIAGFALVAVAASQVLFMMLSGKLEGFQAQIFWTVEALLYLALAVAALLVATRPGAGQAAAAAIALGAVFNVIQLVMGLAMFLPLAEAGLDVVYNAVHAAAFAFYFVGKVLFGAAAAMLGLALRARGGAARLAGGTLALAGTAALAVNAVALGMGESLALSAGATGTLAALGAGLALTAVVRGAAANRA